MSYVVFFYMNFGPHLSANVLRMNLQTVTPERDGARSRASRKAPNLDIIMAVCLAFSPCISLRPLSYLRCPLDSYSGWL
jgi:hypothetical protein